MEFPDILSDDMDLTGFGIPDPLPLVALPKTLSGEVIDQCVDPDVDHLRPMARDGNAPAARAFRGTRDTDVFETASDEAQHFIPPRCGYDTDLAALDQALQLLLICRQPEEEILFLYSLRCRSMVWTKPTNQILIEIKILTTHTVKARVTPGVHVIRS